MKAYELAKTLNVESVKVIFKQKGKKRVIFEKYYLFEFEELKQEVLKIELENCAVAFGDEVQIKTKLVITLKDY